jgi:hypothetical protein
MKRLLTLIASVLALASCSGYVDYTDPDNVPEGVLRIFADKTEIAADGTETVTFTVKFGSKDVSKDADMNLIRVVGDDETSMKPGVNVFTTTAPAEYRFKARYYSGSAHYTDNEVVVVARSVSQSVGQKNYFRKLWGMQFTAVSCTYCPELTTSLKNVMTANPDKIVLTSFHVMFNEATLLDPMRLAINEDFRGLVKHSDGLPLFAFNMVKDKDAIVDEQDKIEAALAGYGSGSATCGLALETSYDSASGNVTVTGKVTSNVAQSLRYHILLVEDGIEYTQAGADGIYVHNRVVRDVLADNKWGDALNQSLPVEEGVEVSVTRTMKVAKEWNADRMRVVFAVLEPQGDAFICGNINECALGASVDYIYND